MKVDIYNTDKKYNIIYADPPWSYKTWTAKGGHKSASAHYETMNKEEIQEMKKVIEKISDKDAILFLTVFTSPCKFVILLLFEQFISINLS